jgi:hypothetical protein
MIRNLKVLMAAAMALAAFSVLAQAAQAAPKFTAPGVGAAAETTITLQPDEAAGTKTAHHVFDIKGPPPTEEVLSITCNELTGDGVVKGESTESVTITPHYGKTNEKGVFETKCNFAGQEVEVSTGACDYNVTASGLLHVETDKNLTGECKIGANPIVFERLNCKVEVGAQTVEGIKFHEGPERGNPKKKTITLEANNLVIKYKATGTLCPFGEQTNGTYTTGNTIITGSKKGSVAETEMVGIAWDKE